MRKRLIWPGIIFVLLGALVTMDVIMLVASSSGDLYWIESPRDPAKLTVSSPDADAPAEQVREDE